MRYAFKHKFQKKVSFIYFSRLSGMFFRHVTGGENFLKTLFFVR